MCSLCCRFLAVHSVSVCYLLKFKQLTLSLSCVSAADSLVTPRIHVTDSAHFHISSVRTLATYVTSSSVLIFSAGGRGQLCAWAADVTGGNTLIGQLRWLAYHSHHVTWQRRKSANCDQLNLPDIRYMKVTTFSANDLDPYLPADLFILVIACSDGFVRLVVFDNANWQFSDVAKSDFHGNCVLQVTHVIYRQDTSSQNLAIVFSAGTDGRICVWDVTDVVRSFSQKYCHQCQCSDIANNSASLTNCVDKSCSERNIAGQETKVNDTLASSDSTADRSEIIDASERLVVSHDCLDQTGDGQAQSHRIFDEAGISEETKACERQGSELEPCCVITAHQSGINSLAVRLRLSGAL